MKVSILEDTLQRTPAEQELTQHTSFAGMYSLEYRYWRQLAQCAPSPQTFSRLIQRCWPYPAVDAISFRRVAFGFENGESPYDMAQEQKVVKPNLLTVTTLLLSLRVALPLNAILI